MSEDEQQIQPSQLLSSGAEETPSKAFAPNEQGTKAQPPALMTTDQDALMRINLWLDRLEDQAKRLLETFQPEDLEPAQAANVASKYITLIARLLELRQQFTTETSGEEERLLRIIFGG